MSAKEQIYDGSCLCGRVRLNRVRIGYYGVYPFCDENKQSL